MKRGAIAVISVAERGTMFDPGPCVYMEKIAVGPEAIDVIDLDRATAQQLVAAGVSAVVNAEVDGAHLADQDIVGFNMLLLIAGNETTTNLLGNMLNTLVDRPQVYARLVREPELIPAAVDEALRFDSPVQFLRRTLTKPATFHGQPMAVGDTVTVLTGSANRDEQVYTNADVYDIDRQKVNHHSFGFGIHFCIGAPLARLEAQCAIRHLVHRFPHLTRGTGRNERIGSFLLRGFHHLWLELGV